MPFAVPLVLTMRLRKWPRRRFGRKLGNFIGKAAIITFAGPPLLIAVVLVLLLLRLALAPLAMLQQV